jgi:hypothetical protein
MVATASFVILASALSAMMSTRIHEAAESEITFPQVEAAAAQTRSPGVDATLQGGILTLVQEFGKARYSRCYFTVFYNQPPMPRTDRVELSCTPLPHPRVDDVATRRDLAAEEVASVAKLAMASNLYSGGHVGTFRHTGSEGPWERLEVRRCCGTDNTAVLITNGNPTFTTGSRRDLLALLGKWRAELLPKLAERKAR